MLSFLMLSFDFIIWCYYLPVSNVIIWCYHFLLSFFLVQHGCYHLCYHLMLSFFVIISPLFSFSWKRDTLEESMLFFLFSFHWPRYFNFYIFASTPHSIRKVYFERNFTLTKCTLLSSANAEHLEREFKNFLKAPMILSNRPISTKIYFLPSLFTMRTLGQREWSKPPNTKQIFCLLKKSIKFT
jgi:hypothetical protein